jgi:hypothetical protein
MRIKLLDDFRGRKAGGEWDCPFAALATQLIEAGTALAVEACDLHLNPAPAALPTPETPTADTVDRPATTATAGKPKRVSRK